MDNLSRVKIYVFLILASVFIFSCDYKSQSTIENLLDNFSFNTTLSNSTQIIVKAYDSTVTYRRSGSIESFNPIKEFKTHNKQQVKDFESIFENAEKTSYCCCPTSSYSLHFFNQKEMLALFYVDTLQFKDKVRVYEGSFQYSYIIEKQKWLHYLKEIDKK
ncbi:hypothetical protein HNP37_003129 [Flavobacterium nitrogenifigens]|uniref:Lipoprotein n=2 Tax=Flavobacterium TaxID=237 RepID=A0A7W7IYQ4_9FLAO|nr:MULTISPECIES: hypothetical protein [Flavobacterium]MBB4803054.1 hypothetical protein [Flavobacterium nitrogenifigens]MBB6388012.1 hypothetical protein [Flavobacterium notoginsengisoli]